MDPNVVITEMESAYPILLLPKKCISLETNCKITDNMFIHVNTTSPDTEGNNTCIYSGFCKIKLIDSDDVSIQFTKTPEPSEPDSDDTLSVVLADQQSQYNQSEVWIDPARSPYVYNQAISESQESYSVCHQTGTSITVQQQHNTYITKYKYREAIHYSTHEEVEKKPKLRAPERQNLNGNMYEADEFECGVFLTQLAEKIINEKQKQAIQEINSNVNMTQNLFSSHIIKAMKTDPTAYHMWQVKLLLSQIESHNRRSLDETKVDGQEPPEPLISNEYSISIKQKVSNTFDGWELKIEPYLRKYLGLPSSRKVNHCEVHLKKVLSSFIVYFDLTRSSVKFDSDSELLVMLGLDGNLTPEAVSKIGELLR